MRVNNQPNTISNSAIEDILNTHERALPTFSESLEGVVTKKFPGGFAPRPPGFSLLNGPPQTPMLDPRLSTVSLTFAPALMPINQRDCFASLSLDSRNPKDEGTKIQFSFRILGNQQFGGYSSEFAERDMD